MLPIQNILSRIRWDPRYRVGRFELGYFDRVARQVVTVPFTSVRFPAGIRHVFEITDEDGFCHRVPFHRVRCVYRDGRLIWERRIGNEAISPGKAGKGKPARR